MLQFNLLRKTITNIVDRFIRAGSPHTELGKQQTKLCATEIQILIENQVVDTQRFDKSCIDTVFGLLVQKS